MKKQISICIICFLLIGGCLFGFFYLSTHDVFKTKNVTEITKSSDLSVTTLSSSENSETVVNTDSSGESNDSEAFDQISELGEITVEEGLLTMTMTMPASIMGEVTQEQIDQAVAEADGFISGTVNPDGSVTYVLTKEKHEELMEEAVATLDQSLQEIVDSEDYPNIVSISHNDDFTEFVVKCKSGELNLTEQLLPFNLYLSAGLYYLFLPEVPDNVHLEYVNAETGELFFESDSKDLGDKDT